MKKEIDLNQQREEYVAFIEQQKTMVLSSLDLEGNPFTSYAPYVLHEGTFYIYISKISDHYAFIEKSPKVSGMILADEADSPNLFARKRARFECTSKIVADEAHEHIFEVFNEKHGKPMLDLLRGLDFSLFELTPEVGRYVVGFGKAFDINMATKELSHVVVDKNK